METVFTIAGWCTLISLLVWFIVLDPYDEGPRLFFGTVFWISAIVAAISLQFVEEEEEQPQAEQKEQVKPKPEPPARWKWTKQRAESGEAEIWVLTDKKTGCQYLVLQNSQSPLSSGNGDQVGCGGSESEQVLPTEEQPPVSEIEIN